MSSIERVRQRDKRSHQEKGNEFNFRLVKSQDEH